MEANCVFKMQRNYIVFQTPRRFSVYSHFTDTNFTRRKRVRVRARLWELWVVGKQFVLM